MVRRTSIIEIRQMMAQSQPVNYPFTSQTLRKLPLSPQHRPTFKVGTQLPSNVAPSDCLKKSSSCATLHEAFNQSLISRIREVHRLNQQDLTNALKTDQQYPPRLARSRVGFREQAKGDKEGVGEEGGEMSDLRCALDGERRRNEQLVRQIEQYECKMFALGQQVEQLKEELQEKEALLLKTQQQLCLKEEQDLQEYEELLRNHDKLEAKCQHLQQQLIIKDQLISAQSKPSAHNFKIVHVISQRVISVPSLDKLALLKAGAEIASLKKHHQAVLRQREVETEQLRRKFVRNLNHYKDIIIKFTSKADGKVRESLLESTFTENSSNEDIM